MVGAPCALDSDCKMQNGFCDNGRCNRLGLVKTLEVEKNQTIQLEDSRESTSITFGIVQFIRYFFLKYLRSYNFRNWNFL